MGNKIFIFDFLGFCVAPTLPDLIFFDFVFEMIFSPAIFFLNMICQSQY